MDSTFEIDIVPDESGPKVSVVPTKQKTKRATFVSKKGREMDEAKDAIGGKEWWFFYRLVNPRFYFADVQYQRTMLYFRDTEGDRYLRFADMIRKSTQQTFISVLSPYLHKIEGLNGHRRRVVEITNNIEFLNSYSIKDYHDSRKITGCSYDVEFFHDFMTSAYTPAVLSKATLKVLSEKPFSTAIRKAETVCDAKFRGKYHTVIFNVRLFSYAEKLLTERKNLQALVYLASTLGSLLHEGGSLVIEALVGYSIGTPLDAFVDVVHLLASDFADAKCVKTSLHSVNPGGFAIVLNGFKGGSRETLWREWSSKENPSGSCGINVSPPRQIPSVRLFDRPVDKGVRKALAEVDKELDRIRSGDMERALRLKKRLDDAIAVSDEEADKVFSEIYEETRSIALEMAVGNKIRVPLNLIFGVAEAKRMVMKSYGERSPGPTIEPYPGEGGPASPVNLAWITTMLAQREMDAVDETSIYARKKKLWHSHALKRKMPGKSQAYLKLSEIMESFEGLGRAKTSFHVCEAPGQFVKRLEEGNPGLRWRAQSLNPDVVKSAFKDEYGMIRRNRDRWIFGPDGTGSILSESNAQWYMKNVRADLITSDCGLEFTPETYGKEEVAVAGLTRAAFRIARACVNPGGSFVMKLFLPLAERETIDELRKTSALFRQSFVAKPSLNPTSTEVYMVFLEALPPERRPTPEGMSSFRSKHDHAVGKFIAKLRTETIAFSLVASYFEQDEKFMATLASNAEIRAEKWVRTFSAVSPPSGRR
jgi:23S rRNA U2552 (ribose-2'-O)-methylase RlmE/FtsJ